MPRSRRVIIVILAVVAVAAAVVFWACGEENVVGRVASLIIAILFALAAVAEFAGLLERLAKGKLPQEASKSPPEIARCGERPFELGSQRLSISTAFGMYFVGLLERDQGYVHIDRQVDILESRGQSQVPSISAIYKQLASPSGARILVLASEGGMGKSTLAARIVRCLHEQGAMDVILGDSAKTQEVDATSGEVRQIEPGYYDATGFHRKLREQLGLPPEVPAMRQHVREIKARLLGRRAIIVVDNLETVTAQDRLLESFKALASRDARIIVTTRQASGISGTSKLFLVHLKPLLEPSDVVCFLRWHIERYRHTHHRLSALETDLDKQRNIKKLIERTGGVPLLMQIVASDVARLSWSYLDRLPALYGRELLDHLYGQAWDQLGEMGDAGDFARDVLRWIADKQYTGRKVSSALMLQWASEVGKQHLLAGSLDLLYERFLVLNNDLKSGNFSVVPSLAEFLQHR